MAPELDDGKREYSPATDWFDFGVLAAQLFGVIIPKKAKRDFVRTAVLRSSVLRDQEKELIQGLLQEVTDQRLTSGDIIIQAIKNVLSALSVATTGFGRAITMGVRFNPTQNLQNLIARSSGGTAPSDDPVRQVNWIKHDLRGDIRVIARRGSSPHYILKGEHLEYRVKPWTLSGTTTWDVGYCESAETNLRQKADDQLFSTGERKIDVRLFPAIARNIVSIRDRSVRWDYMFPFRTERTVLSPELRDIHDYFRATLQLDIALTAAQICQVNILASDRNESHTTIEVTPLHEMDRAELARSLGLDSPSNQLREWFKLGYERVESTEEDDPRQDRFSLLEGKRLDSDTMPGDWRFVEALPHKDGARYCFRTRGVLKVRIGEAFLARNHGGTFAQIRRRRRAIDDMKSHEDLLRLLASPQDVFFRRDDDLPDDPHGIEIDPSKKEALTAIWNTQPFFALQGPPGTGKTTLILSLLSRLLYSDETSQVLVTAHSHHTVVDVRKKVANLFQKKRTDSEPIIVRIGANEPTEHDVGPITQIMLDRLASSKLSTDAPLALRQRAEAASAGSLVAGERAEADIRAMQTLVQDAANITLSTSNSSGLADAASRGRRFDWSILEEAGKAHGFDMALALQESHRLLMLGDHRQLPPYNSRVYSDLLGDPLRVKKSIQLGAAFAPGYLDSSLVEESEERASFSSRCERWRQMVNLFAVLFEQSSNTQGQAQTLTDQHRMHPHIASLVGQIFYPATTAGGTIIHTPDDAMTRFMSAAPYSIAEQSWLPDKRVIWCDVPWIQKDRFATGEKSGLFVSQSEVDVLLKVLGELRPSVGSACNIQILSPYNDQLRAIRSALDESEEKGALPFLFSEPFLIQAEKRRGATVDQFQGSEADIIIVSLVRNNALPARKSLGFLKESNRMNVMLSRAKHLLVVVGSWSFFESRCTNGSAIGEEYEYIDAMMRVLKAEIERGNVAKVEYKK